MALPRWTLWPCIALGLWLAAVWTIPTPAPRGLETAPTAFSAARAYPIIQDLARAPHPVGSLEHDRVRDGLLARMAMLGLNPRVERGLGVYRGRYAGGDVIAGRVENLVGVLPGRDLSAPAVLLMAHYDSVPLSPGAADDMTGVASVLETVRALKAGGPLRRDVIVLLTDGEEAGLLGAELFFRENRLAAHAGAAINAEARGDAGRVAMFQTGAGNGEMVRLFARAAQRPFANSVTGFVYALLPNDTDFTVVARRGLPGLNFAFLGDQLAYHTALSTPAHLDRGSVQHMGSQILSVAHALAEAPALPRLTPDAVYSDIAPGLPMLVYPAWAGWMVVAAAAGLLLLGGLGGRPRIWSLAAGLGVALAAAVLAGLALAATGWFTGAALGDMVALYRLLGPYAPLFAGEALIAFGVVLAVYAFARRLEPDAAWIGAVALGIIVASLVQALAPGAAILFAWPALVGAAALVVGRFAGRLGPWLSAASAVLMLAILSAWACELYAAVGPPMPAALALFVLLLLPTFAPLLAGWSRASAAPALSFGVLVLGVAAVAWAETAPPSAARPALSRLDVLADPSTGRVVWLAPSARLDPWTRAALGKGPLVHRPEPPLFDQPVWTAPAPSATLAPPEIAIAPVPGGSRITARATGGGRRLDVYIRSAKGLSGARLDGLPVALRAKPGAWAGIRVSNPGPAPMILDLPAPGPVEALAVEIRPGWPTSPPPRPRSLMGATGSDETYVLARAGSVR